MRPITAILGALLLAPALALAQAPAPHEVLLRSSAAAKAGDWPAYASHMHPEALAGVRAMFIPIVEADTTGKVAQTFFGGSSTDELKKATDAELFARLFAGLSKSIPAFAEALASSEMQVVGSLPEPPDLVHVVYRFRARAEQMGIQRTQVASLKKHGGDWKLMLTGSIEGLAARLKQAVPR